MKQEIFKDELVLLGLTQPLSIEEQIIYLRKSADQLEQDFGGLN